MRAVEAAFKQKKALVGAFFVITNLRMELFEALVTAMHVTLLLAVIVTVVDTARRPNIVVVVTDDQD